LGKRKPYPFNRGEWQTKIFQDIDKAESVGMEITELITSIGGWIIVATGWFAAGAINGRFSRKNEIAKEARQYRIETCQLVVEMEQKYSLCKSDRNSVNKAEIFKMFELMARGVFLYGTQDEMNLMQELSLIMQEPKSHSNFSATQDKFAKTFWYTRND
jgi:hypothetical protein